MTILEILEQCRRHGFDPALQNAIIESNDPEWAYRFAHDMPDANLELLESVILASSHPRVVYDFALIKSERGGSINALEDHIIASGDAGLMILFASDIKGADIERIVDILGNHVNPVFFQLLEAEMKQRGIEI